jgi:hypothetical protein
MYRQKKNPTHIFKDGANYSVSFIVANNKGCRDTLNRLGACYRPTGVGGNKRYIDMCD